MNTGLFLSKDVVSEVRGVFNLSASDPKGFEARKRTAKSYLLESNWERYQDVYISLYVLSLSEDQTWSLAKTDPLTINLQALLDIELVDLNDEIKAPNEFAVHDLMRFRQRLLEILPAGTQMTQVGIGCALLKFAIPLNETYQATPDGPERFKSDLRDYIVDNGWMRLVRRFGVADYHL